MTIFAIDLFVVGSHLIKPGGACHGCAHVNLRVASLGWKEVIKMVGSCCAFGCANCVGKRPGTRLCRFPAFLEFRRQE